MSFKHIGRRLPRYDSISRAWAKTLNASKERQLQLLRELEDEDKLSKEKEAKKQKENAKKKEKKKSVYIVETSLGTCD